MHPFFKMGTRIISKKICKTVSRERKGQITLYRINTEKFQRFRRTDLEEQVCLSLWLPPSATVLSISSAVFDAKVQGALAAYISANFPVSCAISKSIPSKRYHLSPNITPQILLIYKVFLSLFRNTFDIFIFKSHRVLFCQLLCSVKKRKKYRVYFAAEKQKTGAGAV